MSHKYEVIVIGGGPVGATALATLGHAGISAIGIERETEPWASARAVHFDGETQRLLQTLGLADDVVAHSRPMCDFRFLNEENEPLLAKALGQLGPQAWHDNIVFHQPNIEPILRAEVDRLPGVELRVGTTLLDFEQDTDGVHCRVQNPDGTVETIEARWMLACDGATSTVRHQLGLRTENLGSDDPWLIVDGVLRGSEGIPGDMVYLGHYTRPAMWLRLPGDRVRMEFKVMPGDNPEEIVTPQGVERVSRGVLSTEHFTPDRVAIYTFRARLTEKWRVGSVFLAGDAAHQAPPLYGQGLCAGMRDVANLIWKMRLVSRGAADESLLDTYETERRAHAKYWVESAANMARLLQTTDPEVAAGATSTSAPTRRPPSRRSHRSVLASTTDRGTSARAGCRSSPCSPTGAGSTTSWAPASSSPPSRSCSTGSPSASPPGSPRATRSWRSPTLLSSASCSPWCTRARSASAPTATSWASPTPLRHSRNC